MCNPRKRSFRGPHAEHPDLENKAEDFVHELHGTEQAIHYKAVELAHRDSLPRQEFKSSKIVGPTLYEAKGICSSLAVIHLPQKQPDSYEDKLISFQRYDTRLREERMFPIQIKNRH